MKHSLLPPDLKEKWKSGDFYTGPFLLLKCFTPIFFHSKRAMIPLKAIL
jgi:hypothetical protein